jgi:hypothetical protein
MLVLVLDKREKQMRTSIFQRFERSNEKNTNICSFDEKIIVLIKQSNLQI